MVYILIYHKICQVKNYKEEKINKLVNLSKHKKSLLKINKSNNLNKKFNKLILTNKDQNKSHKNKSEKSMIW